MKPNRIISLVFTCIGALSAAGCATRPASGMGDSVRLAMSQQVIDPGAALNDDPVQGMDGKAAKSGYDAFQKSYRSPQPQSNTFTIGIGGAR